MSFETGVHKEQPSAQTNATLNVKWPYFGLVNYYSLPRITVLQPSSARIGCSSFLPSKDATTAVHLDLEAELKVMRPMCLVLWIHRCFMTWNEATTKMSPLLTLQPNHDIYNQITTFSPGCKSPTHEAGVCTNIRNIAVGQCAGKSLMLLVTKYHILEVLYLQK